MGVSVVEGRGVTGSVFAEYKVLGFIARGRVKKAFAVYCALDKRKT